MDILSLFCVLSFIVLLFLVTLFYGSDSDLTLLYYEKLRSVPKLYFKDQVVWITGASSGIGEFLAYEFANSQAKLVLSGVSIQKLEKVKKNCIEKYNLKTNCVLLLPFLIENFSEHDVCVNTVIDTFGKIDILINNAGVSQRADFRDIEIEADLKLFNINVFGAVNLTRKILKYMFERNEGHVVVTSSIAGKFGSPYSSGYTGSKHALHGYFECLRAELVGRKNIHVTIACPGPVFSDLRSRLITSKPNELCDENQKPTDNKMSTERCSHLIIAAIAYKLHECWICKQPILIFYYLAQYTPTFFRNVLLKLFFNKKAALARRAGRQ